MEFKLGWRSGFERRGKRQTLRPNARLAASI
jgi:hypothetical protein